MEITKAVSDLAFVEQHLTGNSDNSARCRPLPQRTKPSQNETNKNMDLNAYVEQLPSGSKCQT